jgi:hypothetical protein
MSFYWNASPGNHPEPAIVSRYSTEYSLRTILENDLLELIGIEQKPVLEGSGNTGLVKDRFVRLEYFRGAFFRLRLVNTTAVLVG